MPYMDDLLLEKTHHLASQKSVVNKQSQVIISDEGKRSLDSYFFRTFNGPNAVLEAVT